MKRHRIEFHGPNAQEDQKLFAADKFWNGSTGENWHHFDEYGRQFHFMNLGRPDEKAASGRA